MIANQRTGPAFARWLLIWTTIGCVFAVQLYWYYELPLKLSIFWGLADWYLWGVLALGISVAVGLLKAAALTRPTRLVLYLMAAPAVAAIHVVLTMLIGGADEVPTGLSMAGYFQALYAKKLTLNILAFAVIVAVHEHRRISTPSRTANLAARLGDKTRLVNADQVIHGEVCGNYVNLHTADGVWPVRNTLTQLLERLPPGQFIKTSRSGMVNLDRVLELNVAGRSHSLLLSDGTQVAVSRRQLPKVRRAIRDYCGGPTKNRNAN